MGSALEYLVFATQHCNVIDNMGYTAIIQQKNVLKI